MTDLQTIKAMLKRAGAEFALTKAVFPAQAGPKTIGLWLVIDEGSRHTANMLFNTKGALITMEGGGY